MFICKNTNTSPLGDHLHYNAHMILYIIANLWSFQMSLHVVHFDSLGMSVRNDWEFGLDGIP